MEILLVSILNILFLFTGYYLGTTDEKRVALRKSVRAVMPKKKHRPVSREDRAFNKKLSRSPKILHKAMKEQRSQQQKGSHNITF